MAGRFAPLRRPRMQTDEEWLENALRDARMMLHRADDALAFDFSFVGPHATEDQARADGLELSDITAAEKVLNDAAKRVDMLFAAANSFRDAGMTARLEDAANELDEATTFLKRRIAAFRRYAENFEAERERAAADGGDEDFTDEQLDLLDNPPVLREERRAAGSGAPYLGLSDADLESLWVMYVDWRWTQARIADILQCSPRKVRELLKSNDVDRPAVEHVRIEEAVREHMRAGAHGIGIRKICGYLEATGVVYSWHAVGDAMARVDPVGRDQRYRRKIPRVKYNVKTVNGMWHFDGYEHLVHWNICECSAGRSRVLVCASVSPARPSVP